MTSGTASLEAALERAADLAFSNEAWETAASLYSRRVDAGGEHRQRGGYGDIMLYQRVDQRTHRGILSVHELRPLSPFQARTLVRLLDGGQIRGDVKPVLQVIDSQGRRLGKRDRAKVPGDGRAQFMGLFNGGGEDFPGDVHVSLER